MSIIDMMEKEILMNPDEDGFLDDETNEISLDELQPSPLPTAANRFVRLPITVDQSLEILLIIHGLVERMIITEERPIILGRSSDEDEEDDRLDLTPYGAMDRGVSRTHARLFLENGQLYIVDLDSTNGTFIGGQPLEPFTPLAVEARLQLMLARLPLQILF